MRDDVLVPFVPRAPGVRVLRCSHALQYDVSSKPTWDDTSHLGVTSHMALTATERTLTMADITSSHPSEHSIPDIARYLTRSFEGYFVPIQVDSAHLLDMVRLDSVDLDESRLLSAKGSVIGVALIARRGWTSRVAAMGIVPEWRNKGAGKFLMQLLIDEARGRGDRQMVLEVIVQNEAAVHLYEHSGFKKVRRLVALGFEGTAPAGRGELEEVDIRRLGAVVAAHGAPHLPWQLSPETISQFARPSRAYRMNGAYALISDPRAAEVAFRCLIVESATRHMGRATDIIRAILGCHGSRRWRVPAIFPEEIVAPFERVGFQREPLAQWQMSLHLGSA